MERAKTISIISIIALAGMVGYFAPMYFITTSNCSPRSEDYNELWDDYQELLANYTDLLANYQLVSGDYDDLLIDYQDLNTDYQTLSNTYSDLLDDYQNILSKYNALVDFISQQILPVQYCTFAEAVRRYYLPIYLNDSTLKDWYSGYAKFCRDVILHDSFQNNSFINVSHAFNDILKFGNDTMYLAEYIMNETFWDWLPNWAGYGLTGNELTDIDTITQWCIDEIEYEYDTDITYGQDSPSWDYAKFSIETAFRTLGDCEDQAILAASYLESCGYETALVISHDPDHPTLGAFYHGSLLVHIEDNSTFWAAYPSAYLWCFGENDPYDPLYTWCWLDPTWDVPFGTTPPWLQDYIDFSGGISLDNHSIAICDVNGTVF